MLLKLRGQIQFFWGAGGSQIDCSEWERSAAFALGMGLVQIKVLRVLLGAVATGDSCSDSVLCPLA